MTKTEKSEDRYDVMLFINLLRWCNSLQSIILHYLNIFKTKNIFALIHYSLLDVLCTCCSRVPVTASHYYSSKTMTTMRKPHYSNLTTFAIMVYWWLIDNNRGGMEIQKAKVQNRKEPATRVARNAVKGHFNRVRALSLYQAQGGCTNTWIDLTGECK